MLKGHLKLNLDANPQGAESLAKCGEHFSFEIFVISLWFRKDTKFGMD